MTLAARTTLALLAAGTLAACDPPLEELSDARAFVVEAEQGDVYVRSRYDALQGAWYTTMVPVLGPEVAIGRVEAIRLIEGEVGERICEDGTMRYAASGPWGLTGDLIAPTSAMIPLESRGGWQIFGRCSVDGSSA